MDAHKNFAYSTVATAPSPATSGTSLVVASGHGALFPAVPFNATIWPANSLSLASNAEIVRVTAISTDTFTITRAQEGTSARSVVVGDQIVAAVTARTLAEAEETVETSITQASHGLAVGDVVRHNGSAYVKAQADSGANAEVVGIVSVVVTSGVFRMVTSGMVTGLSGLTAGTVYYLDDDTAGLLTATAPSEVGDISKPVLIANSTTTGYFNNFRGVVIGEENPASAQAVARDITQASHGFTVGEVVYYTGSAYDEAKADDPATAEVVGIVSAVADANTFTLLSSGYITGLSGLTAGTTYFLSTSTAGALGAAPATVGHVSKPLLIADSTTSGYFFNMRGQVVGYSSAEIRERVLGWQTIPDATGEAFFQPADVDFGSSDLAKQLVLALGLQTASQPSVKHGVYGAFRIPKNFGSGATILIEWSATLTSGNVVFDFDYNAVGGNDAESLDPAGWQESLTVTDTAPGTARRKLTASLALTDANLAVDDVVEFFLGRDGADGADTMAGRAYVFDVYFQYSDV